MTKPTSSPIRVAIAGIGWFGRKHFDTWQGIPNARVVAVCDIRGPSILTADQAEQDAFHNDAHAGISSTRIWPPFYSDVEAMLEAVEVDLLDVVTVEDTHETVALAAIRRGINVLVEKPLATSWRAAQRILDAAVTHQTHVYVGHVLRFDPRYVEVINAVRGARRRVKTISSLRSFQPKAAAVYRRVNPIYGALVHDIDIAIALTGQLPESVFAEPSWVEVDGFPAATTCLLRWANGATAVLQNNWHLSSSVPTGFLFETTVFCDGFTAAVRNSTDVQLVTDHQASSSPECHLWPNTASGVGGALREELTHAAIATAKGVPSWIMPPEEAAMVMQTCDALIRSSRSGKWEKPTV